MTLYYGENYKFCVKKYTYELELFSSKKELIRPFKTARSTVSKKEILIIVFYLEKLPVFAFELPLSPSLGEMPVDVIKYFKSKNRLDLKSVMVERAISYFKGLKSVKNFNRPKNQLVKIFKTLGINDFPELIDKETIYRFKASKKNIKDINQFVLSNNIKWCVEFNQSLDIKEFESILSEINFSKCEYIEAPFDFNYTDKKIKSNIPIFADEILSTIDKVQFVNYDFKGAMLKPLKFNFDELLSWINYSYERNLPFYISNVASDTLGNCFIDFWNNLSLYKYEMDYNFNSFFADSLTFEKNPYEITKTDEFYFDASCVDEIKKNYKSIASIRVKI